MIQGLRGNESSESGSTVGLSAEKDECQLNEYVLFLCFFLQLCGDCQDLYIAGKQAEPIQAPVLQNSATVQLL